ncbi:sigma-70 family RNA polymerase sigma factor [Kitasatospora sp. NPDC056531]|uniref:sigma-70 family RNA polymerase sigma factor n=1 Tax=Kitasatospora sp. NPDC056531 TaxID=3345856 RepID=UPI0036949DE4
MNKRSGSETVAAAQAGDTAARDRLIADHLPLIYNVVSRALDGHADVDDVVQETMLRVVNSLDTLRDPSSFRSWLVAVAMNEVRRRWTARKAAPVPGLQELTHVGDPAADFVDLTILRLGLTGQRKEVAEATRWLDEHERDLLSLWWLETGGELTRAELATALSLTPQHTAVRVQRMKEQLEIGRLVVRALAADPPCAELSTLTTAWDGKPAVLDPVAHSADLGRVGWQGCWCGRLSSVPRPWDGSDRVDGATAVAGAGVRGRAGGACEELRAEGPVAGGGARPARGAVPGCGVRAGVREDRSGGLVPGSTRAGDGVPAR